MKELSRGTPQNKPLTLSELRSMDNEPAWYPPEECWAVVFGKQGYVQILDFTDPLAAFVGKLYARKPEQAIGP